MPPFGFGRKDQPQSFTTDITDKEDLGEIKEIAEMLRSSIMHAKRDIILDKVMTRLH
jgi:hypothetical protein